MSVYPTFNYSAFNLQQPYPARVSPAGYPALPLGRPTGYSAPPLGNPVSYPAPSVVAKPASYPAAQPARNHGARQQGGNTPFYSGYGQYFSPAQYPSAMQQMNTAATQWANEWAADAIVRTPWAEMVPTFTEASRMWLRGAQERLMMRRPTLPKVEDWQTVRARAMNGGLLRDMSRLA